MQRKARPEGTRPDNYHYDQLNRITGMDAYYGLNQSTNSWAGLMPTTDFKERVSYDGNGNIQKYNRNNFGETGLAMDSLGYHYLTGTNKLSQITDTASDAIGGGYDLHNQPTNNYAYDSIGNLIKDSSEQISAIKWNVYGKIIEIDHRTTTVNKPTKNIYYFYDAAGNRIGKKVTRGDTSAVNYTWYVRDASGNVMATYTASIDSSQADSSANLQLNEQHIYGSSRLGILTANRSTDANTNGLNNYTSPWTGIHLPYYTGKKQYELTNHLGNVLATITDKKIGVSLSSDSSLIDHYEAEVKTAQDYYPFGMIMPGRMLQTVSIPGGTFTGTTQVNGYTVPTDLTLTSRTGNKPTTYVASDLIDLNEGFESGTSDDVTAYIADSSYAGGGNGSADSGNAIAGGGYRYGFNGKEQDNEVKGLGDQIDYGMRVYDPRAGRFMSVDPLTKQYPHLTPYQFAGNTPIQAIDLDGLEQWLINKTVGKKWKEEADRFMKLHPVREEEIVARDIHGNGVIGRKSHVEAYITAERAEHFVQVGDNIKGGLLGSVGYIFGDEKGAQIGSAGDNILFSLAGIPDQNSSVLSKPNIEPKTAEPSTTESPSGKVSNSGNEPTGEQGQAGISLKNTTPPLPGKGFKYYSLTATIQNGSINIAGRPNTNGRFDFVINNEGQLVLGRAHLVLSNGAKSVLAAGELKIRNGRLIEITNSSGHYLPTIEEGKRALDLLGKMGVNTKGARVTLLNQDGSQNKAYINK